MCNNAISLAYLSVHKMSDISHTPSSRFKNKGTAPGAPGLSALRRPLRGTTGFAIAKQKTKCRNEIEEKGETERER